MPDPSATHGDRHPAGSTEVRPARSLTIGRAAVLAVFTVLGLSGPSIAAYTYLLLVFGWIGDAIGDLPDGLAVALGATQLGLVYALPFACWLPAVLYARHTEFAPDLAGRRPRNRWLPWVAAGLLAWGLSLAGLLAWGLSSGTWETVQLTAMSLPCLLLTAGLVGAGATDRTWRRDHDVVAAANGYTDRSGRIAAVCVVLTVLAIVVCLAVAMLP